MEANPLSDPVLSSPDPRPGDDLQEDWLAASRPARSRRILGWLAGVLVVAIGAGAWYVRSHRPHPVVFSTTPAFRGPIASKVTASGTLSALVTVQVGSQVSGRISRLFVDYNSPVHRGEILATIDPQLFQAALEQARASFQVAEANLAKDTIAARDLERQAYRAQALAVQKLGAEADAQTALANAAEAQAQILAAKAAVQQARANLDQVRVNLAYCTITSPIDGTVISRNVDVGQTVAASLQAPTLFEIAKDLRRMQVDTSVAEADVGRLKVGMPAQFTVDAYPDQTFTGKIRQIRNAPQTIQNVVTYDAVIDVANPGLELKPGMTADVTFIDAQRPHALLIPNTALRFHPVFAAARDRSHQAGSDTTPGSAPGAEDAGMASSQGTVSPQLPHGVRIVWKLVKGKPRPVKIHVGITDGMDTEVVSGHIQAGDPIITDQNGTLAGQARRRKVRMFL